MNEGTVTADQLRLLEEVSYKLRGMDAWQLSVLKDARNALLHAARADEDAEFALAEANRRLGGASIRLAAGGGLPYTAVARDTPWSPTPQTQSRFYQTVAVPVHQSVAGRPDERISFPSASRCMFGAVHGPEDGTNFGQYNQIYLAFSPDENYLLNCIATAEGFRVYEPSPDPRSVLRTQFRAVLRLINRLIGQFIRLLDGRAFSSELVEKFRPFLITHGSHPPRRVDLGPCPFFCLR